MGKTKRKKSRPSGYSVFRFELFKNNRRRFSKVKDANELANREWKKMSQPEKDRLDKIKKRTSVLLDSNEKPIICTCSDTMTKRNDAERRRRGETSAKWSDNDKNGQTRKSTRGTSRNKLSRGQQRPRHVTRNNEDPHFFS
jgi:hypothetical protein